LRSKGTAAVGISGWDRLSGKKTLARLCLPTRAADTAVNSGPLSLLDCWRSPISSLERCYQTAVRRELPGRAGGAIRPGRHLVYPETPMTNLFLTMLEYLGVPTDKLGGSEGELRYLSEL
jgi:hypothetical protein